MSESFSNNAATGGASFPTSGAAPTTSVAQTTAAISYDAATSGYSITIAGRSQTFLPAHLDSAKSTSTVSVYVKTNGATTDSLTLTKSGTSGRFTYQYVGGAFWQRTTQGSSTVSGAFDAIAYGVRTPDAAVPRTGSAEYSVDLIGVETVSNNVLAITGEGKTQIDFASGAVVTHGTSSAAWGTANFSSEARLSSTANSFTGNFRFQDRGEFTGNIEGQLYGPAAQEIGATFSARQSDGRVVAGTLVGRGSATTLANSSTKPLTVSEFLTNDAALLNVTLQGESGRNNGAETFSASSAASSPLIVNYDAGSQAYTVIANDKSQYFLGDRTRGTIRENLIETTPSTDLNDFSYSTFTNLRFVQSKRWRTDTGVSGGVQYRIEDFTYGVETPNSAIPKTGSAYYTIGLNGMAADAEFLNLVSISGFGFLSADFASGKLSAQGQILFAEDWHTWTRAAKRASGTFNATGVISSNANSFSGPISFDGLGSYNGTINGRFYGPEAQEVGAAFTATDGAGGVASGVFVGGQDSLARPSETLETLSKPTSFSYLASSGAPTLGSVTDVSYDTATRSYKISFNNTHLFGTPTYIASLGASNTDSVSSTSVWDSYAGQISDREYVASILKPGTSNSKLALLYSSLAFIKAPRPNSLPNSDLRDGKYYFTFGLPTAIQQMPRSGTGVYNGVAVGTGKTTTYAFSGGSQPSVTSFYDVNGSFNFVVDFFNKNFTSTIDLVGKNLDTGEIYTFNTISDKGGMGGNDLPSFFRGNYMKGQFFGPKAEEVGGTFHVFDTDSAGTLIELDGAMVGKR